MSRESFRRRYARFFGPDPKRDVDDEIAFHFAMRVEELVRSGMTPSEAEDATRQRFGDLAGVRDECRDLGRRRVARRQRAFKLESFGQDVRLALRMLGKNRGFSLAVALTMALGIGANTAVFSVVYGVLLRPLPYRDAESLVRIWSKKSERGIEFFSVSPGDYRDWRAQSTAFAAMGAFERQHGATLTRRGEPQSVEVAAVTPDIFPLLGVGALRGRSLLPTDAGAGAPPVAVIEHALWTTRFGSDTSLIGGDLAIDGRTYAVVGVMPPRFSIPASSARIWTALSLDSAAGDHANRYLRVLGRLAPGVPLERARLELDVVAQRLAREYPSSNAGWSVNPVAVTEVIVGRQFRRALLALLGVVGFVLLIACANSANLQLARVAARGREVAVRAALGGTRGRITRQLLTESTVLGLIAGAAGLALAYGGIALLRAVGAATIPRLDDVRVDGPVLAFTALVALGSGILFGLLPALRASRTDIGGVLKRHGEARVGFGRGVRAALVVAEISLSLILLIGAGLLMRSFVRLQAVDVGFNPAGLTVIPFQLPEASYPDRSRATAFYAALLDQVRKLPGVANAAAVSSAPFSGPNAGNVFLPEGRQLPADQQAPDADYRIITPGYLSTLGARLVRGRDFSELDRDGAPETILISETMARRYWPDEDPVGRRVRIGDLEKGPLHTIVGIVADVRYQSLETLEVRPMFYLSALAYPQRTLMIVARGADGLEATTVRDLVASLDRALPAPAVSYMDEILGLAMATQRFALTLFAVFAGAALLLAATGVYGVMSYLVRQRSHELGVRIALGAPRGTLIASVIGPTLRLTLTGVAVGLVGAWMLTRSIASLLFEVNPTDPATFVGVPLLLIGVAVAASFVPARRATRADPLTALRGEG